MKKVAIIGTVGVPARYGGFETLAHHLVDQLNDRFKLSVYCSKKAYAKHERPKTFNKARLYYLPFNANGIQSIIYDVVSIIHALFYADTLIILGVSGGMIVPFVRLFTRKKIIVNIDGMEWRRAKWGKFTKIFLRTSEKLAVRYSHCDITDNAAIKRYTSKYYKTLSSLIEYGADHVLKIEPTDEAKKKYSFLNGKYAFKVARIEPENNIHVVIEAFENLETPLVIVGNWDKSEYGINLKTKYKNHNSIHLLDAIYDQKELDILRGNCSVYVHGHSAGGTNPSLVEAMYLNLPIVAFDCSYNKATTERKCLYFSTSRDLESIIRNTTSDKWDAIANEMSIVAIRRYRWAVIANKYENIVNGFDYKYKRQNIKPKVSQKLKSKTLQEHGLAHLENPVPYYEELNEPQ